MKVGSLVKCVKDCTETAIEWPIFNYPNKGDILTVSSITPHHKIKSMQMLTFEEGIFGHPAIGLSSWSFREIQPPMDLTEILTESVSLPC